MQVLCMYVCKCACVLMTPGCYGFPRRRSVMSIGYCTSRIFCSFAILVLLSPFPLSPIGRRQPCLRYY